MDFFLRLYAWIWKRKLNKKQFSCSVTNNLQLQDVYSIRGLTHGTSYDLKVRNTWLLTLYIYKSHCKFIKV